MQNQVWVTAAPSTIEKWFDITSALSSMEALAAAAVIVLGLLAFCSATRVRLATRLAVACPLIALVIAGYVVSFVMADTLRDRVLRLSVQRIECSRNAFCDSLF